MSTSTGTAAITAADLENSISEVEKILNYTFKNKNLLIEALTHSSYTKSTSSYQRLEHQGDAVLNFAIANWSYSKYPTIDPQILHLLWEFNASNKKLACAAIRLRLYPYVLCKGFCPYDPNQAFSSVVEVLVKTGVCVGTVKPPKVLADIVESIIAAIYQDSDQNKKLVWEVIKGLLEPLITLETLPLQLMATEYQQDIKKLKAVLDAQEEHKKSANDMNDEIIVRNEIEYAVMKLHELCVKNKWPEPSYNSIEQNGSGNEKKFKFSVMIKKDVKMGAAKSNIKKAKNSAASAMIHFLENYNLN